MAAKTLSTFVLFLFLTAASHAQVVHVLQANAPGAAQDVYLPSAAYPAGGATSFGVEPLPNSGILAPGIPSGGITINQTNGMVISTDGFLIAFDYNPLYIPFTPPPLLPPVAPAPILLSGGPLTGLALDVTTNILWMTDGISLGGFNPAPPFAPVTPVYFLTPIIPGTNQLVGLDIEISTGTLWGCGVNGNIYNFTTAAVPVGLQPVSFTPIAAGSPGLGGLCVNRTNGVPSTGAPFCSTQTTGFHICVTDGLFIYDGLIPTNAPIPVPLFLNPQARGLAMSCDFQTMPGAVICPSTGTFPLIGMNKAAHNGTGGATAFRLVGGPPLTLSLLLYDFCPIPGGLFVFASGETLWINPFSVTFAFGSFVSDGAGDVIVPIDFSLGLAGLQYSMQWAIADVLAPLGYCLSDGMCWTIGTK
ncbi:MAG: hypothetical protein ACI97A_002112 [Planctomycetota bacterium]|jgi:hypothetical protein